MTERGRLIWLAVVAASAVAGFFFVARHTGDTPSVSPRIDGEATAAPVLPDAPRVAAALPSLPLSPPATSPSEEAATALTPAGAARALEAIGKNEQTRRLFERLQRLGLSREQQDRVLLILGTQALRPSQESPTLEALRASGGSRVLSNEEATRVQDERQQIAQRALRGLRPALAAVLTPAQLVQAGLNASGSATDN